MATQSDLVKLGESAGVDFIALREKYSQIRQQATDQALSSVSGAMPTKEEIEKAKQAEENLSKYKICPTCNGLGIKKTKYNHMVLESTCDDCDGDSIVMLDGLQQEIRLLQQQYQDIKE